MIYLFNTLARKKEQFKSLQEKKVRMYTCGPTVYNYAHIGNMRAYIFADILKKTLAFNGYKVFHVINITDVGHLVSDADTGEDKIEKEARIEGKSAWDVSKFYTHTFFKQINELGISSPQLWPRATDHIKEQIKLIKILEKKGYTYSIDDGVYFDSLKSKNYGQLAKLNLSGLKPGIRIEIVKGKKHPADFALWKFSHPGGRAFNPKKDNKTKERQMQWDSPWGVGFPGWHIECSAMSMKYLGETFDIHTGGIDHIPVHHTNEIAQSESATGKKFVNYWLHNNYLVLDKGKMSKSLGGFITLNTLIDRGYDPLAFRYMILTTHYRNILSFSWQALDAAQNTFKAIKELAYRENKKPTNVQIKKILTAINNDLDLPKALAYLHKENNYNLWLYFEPIFSLGLTPVKVKLTSKQNKLISEREKARKTGNFLLADDLRNELLKTGIKIEDTPHGAKIFLV